MYSMLSNSCDVLTKTPVVHYMPQEKKAHDPVCAAKILGSGAGPHRGIRSSRGARKEVWPLLWYISKVVGKHDWEPSGKI